MTSIDPHKEQEWLKRLSQGDRSSFAEIYQAYWEILLGMAYDRLKDIHAAEDVVHDVFASIWSNRHKLEIVSLKSYLAAAVKYNILREARKAAIARSYIQREYTRPAPVILPDALIDNKRILEILHREVLSLPDKCRLVFRLSREKGLTILEISDKMNISTKTVENHLNKALRRLRLSVKDLPVLLWSICWWLY